MYKKDDVWRKVQDYLPLDNRLCSDTEPEEIFLHLKDGNRIHLDIYSLLNPKGIIILFHGVGGNGRLLSFLAVPLFKSGYKVICPDMPLYGYSEYTGTVNYDMWVKDGLEITEYYAKEKLPMFLFGLSAGGMLAYQVACQAPSIRGVLATCILDQRLETVREKTASNPYLVRFGLPIAASIKKWFSNIRIPIKWVANMKAIVNNKELAKLLMSDKKSSGAKISLDFLYTMLHPNVIIEPRDFNIPFCLLHPENDLWTSVSLSRLFYDKIECEKEIHMLKDAGHFPIEEQGLKTLQEKSLAFIEKHLYD
ncbi:alpha/beta hydrolase [Kineothrix sp. MB12-C1]|uniref:alpha/beta hydrolase n=1 Tax=Kineothrix sp. MB12-C1 TaxID=3070215 RepID=UPI0027D32949|nr:alpha/beta fold hydrolase [Kineothrix sp. MB12-C1]WMC93462.1 alpha/beta fold hydrolase [Kineothrix sp. MB12-C1]